MENRQPVKRRGMFYFSGPPIIYYGINVLVSYIYVIIVEMKYLTKNPSATLEEMMALIEELANKDGVLLTLAISAFGLIYGMTAFVKNDRFLADARYENKLNAKDILTAVCVGFGINMLINVVVVVLSGVFDMTSVMQTHDDTVNVLLSSESVLSIITVGIAAPVCEELIFRGMCFNRFRTYYSENGAVYFSAVIFSVMHFGSIVQMCYTFALGVVLCKLYAKYENILVPILIHMCFNLTNYLFMIKPVNAFYGTQAGLLTYYFVMVACVAFVVGSVKKKEKPQLKSLNVNEQ